MGQVFQFQAFVLLLISGETIMKAVAKHSTKEIRVYPLQPQSLGRVDLYHGSHGIPLPQDGGLPIPHTREYGTANGFPGATLP